jgi:adenylosuccinate synthase
MQIPAKPVKGHGIVVVGAQWGDEGKGKILDVLAANFRLFVRFNGGANVGHTIKHGGITVATHLLPSAILYHRRTLLLGQGMVIDPEALLQEIEAIKKLGGLEDSTIYVDRYAHVILPEHKEADRERNKHLGTTGRGIGPCYEDRVGRRGRRFHDLLNGAHPELKTVLDELGKHVRFIDTSRHLHEKLTLGYTVLFEGAQGVLLDVDYGTYPYVTSSSTLAQNAALSCGLPMHFFRTIIGVTKAYTTRVGEGPFPTELVDATGEYIRKTGNEFGATTGRPRRCGWLDVAALRYAIRISGITHLALTKLDVLSGMKTVKVCIGYKVGDKIYDEIPLREGLTETAESVYQDVQGWPSFGGVRYMSDLPDEVRKFVKHIEELVGIPVLIVSTGQDADATIVTDGSAITGA